MLHVYFSMKAKLFAEFGLQLFGSHCWPRRLNRVKSIHAQRDQMSNKGRDRSTTMIKGFHLMLV